MHCCTNMYFIWEIIQKKISGWDFQVTPSNLDRFLPPQSHCPPGRDVTVGTNQGVCEERDSGAQKVLQSHQLPFWQLQVSLEDVQLPQCPKWLEFVSPLSFCQAENSNGSNSGIGTRIRSVLSNLFQYLRAYGILIIRAQQYASRNCHWHYSEPILRTSKFNFR